jgi:hypothetical protein
MEHTPKRGTCDDCEVNWDRKGNVKDIVLCPLHAAAPDLLAALEHVNTTLDNIIGDSELLETYLPLLLQDVRTAIAKGA